MPIVEWSKAMTIKEMIESFPDIPIENVVIQVVGSSVAKPISIVQEVILIMDGVKIKPRGKEL
jgi:hypothetical protein